MCFELDSVPPIPVLSGAAVSHEDLVLEAADGNRLAAFAAAPDESGGPGVVILPDVRGLYRFYEELALRFGERGIRAVAIDYFGRTAGVDKRGDDFDYAEHVAQTTPAPPLSSGAAAKAAKRFPSAASRTRPSCDTAAPESAGTGGTESSSKQMPATIPPPPTASRARRRLGGADPQDARLSRASVRTSGRSFDPFETA